MISLTLWKLAKILRGQVFGDDIIIDSVTTDSRNLTEKCLFVALEGKKFDAHNFAKNVQDSGAVALLTNRKLSVKIPQVIVKDTRLAFCELAAWVRQQSSARIVAITGSSGKTSVKEMTAAILRHCGNTLCTIGNLNNDIGVSMTLLRLTKQHDSAVIEIGSNHFGEVAWSSALVRPEAALVNNFSASHIEGFGSLEGVAREKGEIYNSLPKNGIAIINAESNDWLNWKKIIGLRKTWRFSLDPSDFSNSEFSATNIRSTSHSATFILQTPKGKIDILLPLPGYHNISNALAASALAMAAGASLLAIKSGLKETKPMLGRLFPIFLRENQLLIDDSYNANVSSMKAAVQVLSKMPGYRVLVVGDMSELGDEIEFYHFQIGKVVKSSSCDHVLSVGNFSKRISQQNGMGRHFTDKESLINYLKNLIKKHKIISVLVKGSRNSAMEEVVHALLKEKKHVSLDS